jgi:diacylglycerol O-acyltransferase
MATGRDRQMEGSGERAQAAGNHMTDMEAVMWHVEQDPFLSSTFGSITLLDRLPDVERLRRRLARMAADTPRLRQRVVDGPGPATPLWQVDPEFDIDDHVRHVALPAPGTQAGLLDLARRFVQDPLDGSRPLGLYLIVVGVEGSKAALVQKMHHAITDGIGGVRLSERFVDLTRDAPEPADEGAWPREDEGGATAWAEMARSAQWAATLAQRLAGQVIDDVRHPSRAVALPGEVLEAVRSTARQLVIADRAHSPLWTARTLHRGFEVFDVDFDEAHRAAKALGGSLNDFFIAGATGGAGAYHRHQGVPVADLRVSMPVSTRRDRSAGGNAFVPTRLLVPAGIEDPMERFAAVREVLGEAKREPAIGMAGAFAGLAQLLPSSLLTRAARRQVETIDFATSNVRAASFDLYISGARIDATYAIGPLGGTAFNLTMMSYSGALNMGLHIDRGAVADPALLRSCLVDAFAELIAAGH